jgi:hypothetical protein
MKYAALLIACLLVTVAVERPVVNIPKAARQSNWLGNQGEGSCVHATMISLFRWQGRYAMAERWKKYGNGEGPTGLAAKFEANGIRFAETTTGDVKFLEWSVRTRRGCGVTVRGGTHMVALIGLDAKNAYLLDNNRVDNFIVVPRETFLAEWRASFGWAVTILYCPAAPMPQGEI